MVLNDFRQSEEQFYSKTRHRHIFEWCMLVDNSGTMLAKVSCMSRVFIYYSPKFLVVLTV